MRDKAEPGEKLQLSGVIEGGCMGCSVCVVVKVTLS